MPLTAPTPWAVMRPSSSRYQGPGLRERAVDSVRDNPCPLLISRGPEPRTENSTELSIPRCCAT
ncbi:hypothetical protein CC86DRAFT_137192 [Ophiobolus disseminans]|uniref:Uncharacterized protein n=1 Tax=Ophiobolus disseminans TaxID=1469910 RepID=A0A6A7ADF0_9PLEO|nr:hypothetical protein CC86DRAFT_137192 [Ophiobolus disseminans]